MGISGKKIKKSKSQVSDYRKTLRKIRDAKATDIVGERTLFHLFQILAKDILSKWGYN